ncbi:HemK2/MTQ2 family protein methyltransferase [Nocardia sp. NPDC005366]|uniref:HemK2/MTQ2 family protein methyltransferase n=1 Tax=Nocardia sp. NPDC005366 TaxID=3156878 RepID=UPI0033B02BD7
MGNARRALLCPPGVYRPQADTWLLARAMIEAGIPHGAHALDVFTGTGALAIAAAKIGAATVTAVDISRRAAAAAWLNLRLRGITAEIHCGDFASVFGRRHYDLVVANPPYVPAPHDTAVGAARAWDAGADGRALLDRLCALVPSALSPRGTALIVHSAMSDPDKTLDALRERGLKAAVVARATVPFGPVLRARAAWLSATERIEPTSDTEDLVVIRGDRIRK